MKKTLLDFTIILQRYFKAPVVHCNTINQPVAEKKFSFVFLRALDVWEQEMHRDNSQCSLHGYVLQCAPSVQ